jgi:hypothetical protein
MSVHHSISTLLTTFSFPFLCSGSGASMAKLAGERRSRPTFEIRLSMGYIHGQAPTARNSHITTYGEGVRGRYPPKPD